MKKKKKKQDTSECYYSLDEYADKVGGVSKMTILLQKRAKELIRGMPRLVNIDSDNPIEIAFEELFQNKISLAKPDDILIASEETLKETE